MRPFVRLPQDLTASPVPRRNATPISHAAAMLLLLGLTSLSARSQTGSSPETPTQGTVETREAEPPAEPAARPPATAPALERVEIIGSASDTDVRRESSAAKIVIGRDELDRMGDSSVSEVLKRLPGVTLGGRPGRGGAVRMRGLGSGYTQILINGERMSAGLSLDDLTPEQLERIEVLRAPTAETGAQAIAGTINIVLREDVRKRLNNVHLILTHDDHHWQPSATLSRADQDGAFSYSLNGQISHSDRESGSLRRTLETRTPDAGGAETTTLDQTDTSHSRDRRSSVHLGGRLQWRLSPTDTLVLTPFAIVSNNRGHASGLRTQAVPGSAPDFDRSSGESTSQYRLARLNGQWQGRFEGGARLELRAGSRLSMFDSNSERREFSAGSENRLQQDHAEIREHWWSSGGKYTRNLAGEHQLAAGWEAEWGRRDDSRVSLQSTPGGGTTSLLADFGDNLQADTVRTAIWAQDEWDLSGQWALHGGLRWEGIGTRSDTVDAPVRNHSQVLSPLLHAIYRLEEGGRDQIRASLTRSYRAPTLQNLTARPSINSAFPATGANQPTSPDRAGNPELKPELATGLDLAYEHYLGGGGVLSAGVFHRRINQLIRNQTALETVSWSSVPRHVSRPQNIGNASTSGIELEAKLRLDEWRDGAAPVDLRGNLALFQSRVDGIVGPDNRLDQQPGWSANLGADYRLRSWPLTLGGNLALTPGYAVQQSNTQRFEQDAKRVLDAYLLWRMSPAAQLRFTASNLVARDFNNTSAVVSSDGSNTLRQTALSSEPSLTVWGLRLEMKL